MLYIRSAAIKEGGGSIVGNKEIEYVCKNCNFVKPLDSPNQSLLVSEHVSDESNRHVIYMNKNIKYDPTMPHVDNIPCPNTVCRTKTEGISNDVIYIKYDSTHMRYLYFCTICENFWKND
jgi:ssDNA-specific exonuclease RecJ